MKAGFQALQSLVVLQPLALKKLESDRRCVVRAETNTGKKVQSEKTTSCVFLRFPKIIARSVLLLPT